jgi:hypothetical protein
MRLMVPRAAEHGITLDAQSWQNVLCEYDKLCRWRSGDGARIYTPYGTEPRLRPRKARAVAGNEKPAAATVPVPPVGAVPALDPAAIRRFAHTFAYLARPYIIPRDAK